MSIIMEIGKYVGQSLLIMHVNIIIISQQYLSYCIINKSNWVIIRKVLTWWLVLGK